MRGCGGDLLGMKWVLRPSWSLVHPGSTPTLWPRSPLLGLHVHHQGDVALNEGEGEEADVATVITGSHWVLHAAGRGAGEG